MFSPGNHHQIIRRDSGSRDYSVIQGLQQSQPLLFGTAGDESDLQDNQVIRIFEAQERRRVQELASRQDVNDLEEVVRRNAQRAHQSILNCRRHLAETSLVVLSFEDVDLGDRHLHVLSKSWLHLPCVGQGAAAVSGRKFARHDRSQQHT
jgi:neutral trehalase